MPVNVKNLATMFYDAFNADIGGWDTSSVMTLAKFGSFGMAFRCTCLCLSIRFSLSRILSPPLLRMGLYWP